MVSEANREKARARSREYYVLNRERIRQKAAERLANLTDEEREAERQRRHAYYVKWWAANKERVAEKRRLKKEAMLAEELEALRAYNRERLRAYRQRHKAKKTKGVDM